jgi:predicted esterase
MPKFQLSNKDAPGGPHSDVDAQSKDVAFIIRAMSHLRSPVPGLARAIDRSAIGLSGFSDGGATVLTTNFNPCCEFPHVGAVVATSSGLPTPKATQQSARSTPLLLIRGDADPGYQTTVETYDNARGPKTLLTLRGAPHQLYENPWRTVVERTEIAFLDRYLRNDEHGLQVIRKISGCAPFVKANQHLQP